MDNVQTENRCKVPESKQNKHNHLDSSRAAYQSSNSPIMRR